MPLLVSPGRLMKRQPARLRGSTPADNNWYVDNEAPPGGDGTSWATAWNSFSAINWGALQPGDTVYISGGTTSKVYSSPMQVNASGAPGAPIRITKGIDPGHDGEVILDGEDTLSWGIDVSNCDYVTVSYLTVRSFQGAQVAVWNSTGCVIRDIICQIGLGANDSTAAARGIDVRGTTGTVIRANTVVNQIDTPSQTDGIWLSDNTDYLVEENWIQIDNQMDDGHSDALQMNLNYSGIIRRNTFISSEVGVNNHVVWAHGLREGATLQFSDNICWCRGGQFNTTFWNDTGGGFNEQGNFRIWNNTIFGGSRGLVFDSLENLDVRNNIIWPDAGGVALHLPGIAPEPSQFQTNLIYAPNATLAWLQGSGNLNYAQFTALGYNAGGLNADPLFVDAANGDFGLQANSPARDAGQTIPAIEEDIWGTLRPQGSGYDLGAIEMEPEAPSVPPAGWQLAFSDDFDSLSLWDGQSGTWEAEYPWGGRYNNDELEYYVNPVTDPAGLVDLEPVTVSNGVLSLRADEIPPALQSLAEGRAYSSGIVTTHKSFAFKHGYVEIRAKMPAGLGFWSALWLLPTDMSWPPEIDIAEVLGVDPETHVATVWYGDEENPQSQSDNISTVDLSADFHVYGLLWTESEITWFLDGQQVFTAPTPAGYDKEMYILMNLAVGGAWPGNPDATTPFPSAMEVDYVKVWTPPEA